MLSKFKLMLISLREHEVVVFFANTVLPRFLGGAGRGLETRGYLQTAIVRGSCEHLLFYRSAGLASLLRVGMKEESGRRLHDDVKL